MTLPSRIREARGDLTQERFAALVGVNAQTVSNWERGVQTPELSKVKLIARETGRPLGWFYAENDGDDGGEPSPLDLINRRLDHLEQKVTEALSRLEDEPDG